MDEIQDLINTKLISIGEHDLTLGQLILVPAFVLVGIVILGWIVSLTDKSMSRKGMNPDVIQVVRRAMYIGGLIVLGITTLELMNVPLTAFAFVSGAVAIGVGFGAQNIINNFISGWILIWERPIRINDFIEFGSTSGTVEEINTRSTRIRRVDGVHMLVPNSKLIEESVVNWTLVDKLLRCIVRVGVAYGSDVEKVRQILEEVIKEHSSVLTEPQPQIIFEDFGDSALIFDAYFWVLSVGERSARVVRSDLRFTIDQRFRENNITIAFPQSDVHLNGVLRLQSSSGEPVEIS